MRIKIKKSALVEAVSSVLKQFQSNIPQSPQPSKTITDVVSFLEANGAKGKSLPQVLAIVTSALHVTPRQTYEALKKSVEQFHKKNQGIVKRKTQMDQRVNPSKMQGSSWYSINGQKVRGKAPYPSDRKSDSDFAAGALHAYVQQTPQFEGQEQYIEDSLKDKLAQWGVEDKLIDGIARQVASQY